MKSIEILRGRGYAPAYHMGEINWCPGCGRKHWIIGRVMAECHHCATALPIAENQRMVRLGDHLQVAA